MKRHREERFEAYDDTDSYSPNSFINKRPRAESKPSLSSLSQEITRKFHCLHAEFQQTFDAKRRWVEELEHIAKKAYPQGHFVMVGSSVNMFGFKSSDSDLTLMIPVPFAGAVGALSKIEKLLPKPRFHTELVAAAKVPILKLKDKQTSFEGDINVNTLTSIRHAYLLRCYVRLDPRVRTLGLVIKLWAKKAGIIDQRNHKLSGFSLLILYVYYLQVGCSPPVVPMLQSTYPEHFGFNVPILAIIDHIKTNHEPREIKNFVSPNRQSLGELLVGFYRFYSTFDWSEVISISRPNSYVTNRRPFMRIEDPYEPGGNSARGIYQWFAFSEIKRAFSQAANNLNNDLRLENVL